MNDALVLSPAAAQPPPDGLAGLASATTVVEPPGQIAALPIGASLQPDIAQARQFLAALDPEAASFCFQTFDDSPEKRPHLARTLHGNLDTLADTLRRLNNAGAGVFVTINAVLDGAPRKTANVVRVRALFADADDPAHMGQVEAEIARRAVPPAMVVEGGPGKRHAYWKVTDCPLADFGAIQRAIAAALGTDPSVTDLPRVLRLPGFIHRKGAPFMTRTISTPGHSYTADQIRAAYPQAAAALPLGPLKTTKVVAQSTSATGVTALAQGSMAAAFRATPELPDLNAAAHTSTAGGWFYDLPGPRQNDCLRGLLSHPDMLRRADWQRHDWLPVVAALADAGRNGATEAYALTRAWSASSPRFDPATFDRDWNSLGPRPGGVTVATLLHLARTVGIDLAPWREEAEAARGKASVQAPPPPVNVHTRKLSILPADYDEPRQVIHGLVQRGGLTVLAAAGASGKTVSAVALGVAGATGRSACGPFRLEQPPDGLRILYVTTEESPGRISLIGAGALRSPRSTRTEVRAALARFTIHDAAASGLTLGTAEQDLGFRQLEALVAEHHPDLIVLDNASALFALPNENDNLQVTMLLRRLVRVAVTADAGVLLLHHTPKMSREAAAGLRGDAALVRGGSAWTNTPRTVWTITPLPPDEAAGFIGLGVPLDSVRRMEPVKVNDAVPPDPAFFAIVSETVPPTAAAVRTIRWLPTPAAGTPTPANVAVLRVVLGAVIAGARDARNARVALSPAGRKGGRSAVQYVAHALRQHDPSLSTTHAEGAARSTLADLLRAGIVTREKVLIPKYKQDGSPNGADTREGVVAHPEMAPWWQPAPGTAPAAGSPPASPTAAPTPAALPPAAPSLAAVAPPTPPVPATVVAGP